MVWWGVVRPGGCAKTALGRVARARRRWAEWADSSTARQTDSKPRTVQAIGEKPLDDALEEIRVARGDLLERLGSAGPERWFAFPFGREENITEDVCAALPDLGIDYCLSAYGGVNPPDFEWDKRWPDVDVPALRAMLEERRDTTLRYDRPDLQKESLNDPFQRLFIELVLRHAECVLESGSAPVPPLRLLLLGTAGTGKTTAVQTLI